MQENPITTAEEFRFDDRFYERGQLWRECLESWQTNREDFLRQVHREPLLAKTAECLSRFPLHTRFAIYHGSWTLDSCMSLPTIGYTFSCASGIETRYFCREHFFPVLGALLGRKTPKILLLDEHGQIAKSWGPRPDALTRQMSLHLGGLKKDRWLSGIGGEPYLRELDADLYRFLCS